MTALLPPKILETVRRRGAQLAAEGYRITSEADGVMTISTGTKTHVIDVAAERCDCRLWEIYRWCSHLEGLPGLRKEAEAMGDLVTRERGQAAELVPLGRSAVIPTTLEEITSYATLFAQSGYFTDAKQMAQAAVKIIAGRELGIAPFAAMNGIFIIQGRTTLAANLLAVLVKDSGRYDYRVTRIDDTLCSIDFYERGQIIGKSEFSIDDAKRAATQNIGKFPRNMLFARAMSNGVKWFCPNVGNGQTLYTPEDFGYSVDDNGNIDASRSLPAEHQRAITDGKEQQAATASATTSQPTKMTAARAGAAFKARCAYFGYTGDPKAMMAALLGPSERINGNNCLTAINMPDGGWLAAVKLLQPEPAAKTEAQIDAEEMEAEDPFADDEPATA